MGLKIGNLETYGIIYKIRNKINNKMYIGQTTRATGFNGRYETNGVGIERVYNYHLQQKRYNYPYNDHLLRSIEKYGFNNFEVDEIFDIAFSEEELNKLEYMYIKIYNLTNKKYGYNNKEGGNNYTKTKDTIIKQQKKNCKPLYCITYNKAFISEKQAIDYYKLSCKNIILGAIKNKRSVNINNVETKWEKIDYYTSNYNKKGVICLNDNKVFGKLDDARIYYNISRNDIINNRCKGKFKNIKDGLFFMYVNDYYDKLDNITTEENKNYIFRKFNEFKNNIYGNEKTKMKKKKIFLNEQQIINNIFVLHNTMNYKEIKDFINKNYEIDFHVSEKDIINIIKQYK